MPQTKPTYSLKALRFENFKGIQELTIQDLPETASWIFLTGENGFGKTSILQAIASSLYGYESHTFDIFEDKEEEIYLSTTLHTGNTYAIHVSPKLSQQHRDRFHFLACYGSSRLATYTQGSIKGRDREDGVTQSLYDAQTFLENIEDQFILWHYKEKHSASQERYQSIKKLLIDILGLKDIEVDYDTETIFYIEKDKDGNTFEKVTYRDLASGYRSLIAMIGDMILRLFKTQPEVTNPSDLDGIVIIDELDLHFHPKWQKRLPEILSKYFPKIQFIAATHSPIPLLGAPENSVFLTVFRTAAQGVYVERLVHLEKEVDTLTANLLLNSPIFGYADIFSQQFRKNQKIATANTFEEKNFEEKLKHTLAEGLSPEKQEELRRLLK